MTCPSAQCMPIAVDIPLASVLVDVCEVSRLIPADWMDTSDATALAENLFLGATAYAGGEKITGTATVRVDGDLLIMPSGLCPIGGEDSG